jgi:hypothetical protein
MKLATFTHQGTTRIGVVKRPSRGVGAIKYLASKLRVSIVAPRCRDQADAARSPALRPYSSAEPQCCAPFNSEWPMLMRP